MKGQALTPLFFAFCFGMVLSTLLNQQPPKSEELEPIVMTYRGLDKRLDDLPEDIAAELKVEHQRYTQKRYGLIEDAALRYRLSEYASQTGASIENAAQELYGIDEVTDSDVAAFYAMHREELGKPFFEVREKIRRQLTFERAREKRQSILEQMKQDGDLLLVPVTL